MHGQKGLRLFSAGSGGTVQIHTGASIKTHENECPFGMLNVSRLGYTYEQ